MAAIVAAFAAMAFLLGASGEEPAFHVPETISDEARDALGMLPPSGINLTFPDADDLEGWRALRETFELPGIENGRQLLMDSYEPQIDSRSLGGVPVLDVKPKGWAEDGRLLVYAHWGGYALGSANSSLEDVVPVANDTGMQVVSVDYSLAPEAKWEQVTDEMVAVVAALQEEGHPLEDMALYGNVAGGGLVAGSVLKMRDQGMGMPAAVVMWGPWTDLTNVGDTWVTLLNQSPLIGNLSVDPLSNAYADPADQKHPYVSPVYGDYTQGFPPTLIQVGTKDRLLSDSVRQYQAMDTAGVDVKLDVYEGMWHVFQSSYWNIPEALMLRLNMAKFLNERMASEK
eukprot:evm.model.scf_1385.1 EVM.evm.TU.scf_1385.1   scf_1385:6271-9913(-)